MIAPRFAVTYCSQCGMEQGPGDAGVSRCSDHRAPSSGSHHYSADSVRVMISHLQAFQDPQRTTLADFERLDWRGWCGTIGLVLDHFLRGVPLPEHCQDLSNFPASRIPEELRQEK